MKLSGQAPPIEMDVQACPNCGEINLATSIECLKCKYDFTQILNKFTYIPIPDPIDIEDFLPEEEQVEENLSSPELAESAQREYVNTYKSETDFIMDFPGIAADPETVSVEDADRRAAVFVGAFLFVTAMVILVTSFFH